MGFGLRIATIGRINFWVQGGIAFGVYLGSKVKTRPWYESDFGESTERLIRDDYRKFNFMTHAALSGETNLFSSFYLSASVQFNTHLLSSYSSSAPFVQYWYSTLNTIGLRYNLIKTKSLEIMDEH